ncbi:MAG: ABC transporter ATP-binding protein/permease [Ignavibacteria bacterium]|nr:ABC transporter ATP-binding protein/permease [Ignavibacteria bacterium]
MNKFKQLIKKYFTNFSYFFRYLRFRVFIVLALSIAVGVLDGFGLAMFLPLLQMVNNSSSVSADSLGNLKFLVNFVQMLGFGVNLFSILVLMCVFFILKGIAFFYQGYYHVSVQQLFIRKIRLNNIDGLNSMRYKSFVLSDVGQIQNSLTGEVERVVKAFDNYFIGIQLAIMVLVYMGFAFLIDAQFAILVSVGGGLSNFIYQKIYKKTHGVSYKLTIDNNFFQGLIIQYVTNFKYLKATSYLFKYSKKLYEAVYKIEKTNKKIGVLSSFLAATREPLIIIVVALVIFLQTSVLGSSLGPILISLLFFYRALSYLMLMQGTWNQFLAVSGSLTHMKEFGEKLESNKEISGKKEISEFNSKIELKNASFSYKDKPILEDVDLTVSKNEVIAFVGESGSGKTTLVNLLSGLFPLDKGSMLIDGRLREDLNIATYQNRIGYITQDPVIFNDTIFNNISFWDTPSEENKKKFQNAIKKASVDEFINSLPEKENTVLGHFGVNLSGGQKQRISIARELYKDIDILILDEATSALDSETEKAIQDNIDSLKGYYTILIVAHRLSTIKNANRIVFMSEGKIAQVGEFGELIKKVPNFKRMVELQDLQQ